MDYAPIKIILVITWLMFNSYAFADQKAGPIAQANCQKEYLELFSGDEMSMTVVFGYDDDSYHKTKDQKSLAIFVNTLTTKCSNWSQKMCGFTIQSTNPHIMTRKTFGPDGKVKTLKVIADATSVSDDDKANRLNSNQKKQTQKIRDLYSDGIQNSNVVFYQGHSRDGGGPSFAPPKLRADGHVDYNWYHNNQPDKQFMLDALAKIPNKSRIMGLASCSSIRWFSESIGNAAPATGIIGTDSTFYTGHFEETLPIMENIFSYKCLTDLAQNDVIRSSKILGIKGFQVSDVNQVMCQDELTATTLDMLGNSLSSPDLDIRNEAYQEIKAYDTGLYSQKLIQQIRDYNFGNVVNGQIQKP